ncbi:hypothetical protein FNV43_RR13372 [Rhamnella rubrinervis]|uniref:H15 domain-containing protein n=1 Tax=Rhamnella rubrinervis TaxID=2594499 RepID=A0A8K0H0Z5_9ROSA|nr:hypothetical protein FNV43_RR13372 [Rhamnella rubrinervis]
MYVCVVSMILKAIEALKEEDGVNKSSISKYMESIYGNLPAGHSKFLSDHLNGMKDGGQLVFWKNKPPKPKDAVQRRPVCLGRPRGRPPKHSNVVPISLKVKTLCGSEKRRGRPRKMARSTEGLGASTSTSARKATATGWPRGRPPKVKLALTENLIANTTESNDDVVFIALLCSHDCLLLLNLESKSLFSFNVVDPYCPIAKKYPLPHLPLTIYKYYVAGIDIISVQSDLISIIAEIAKSDEIVRRTCTNLKLEGKANRDCTKVVKGANFSSIMKKRKYRTAVVRRSDRIRNIIKPATKVDVELVIEEIILTGSDEEESQESVDEEDQEDEQHAHMQKQQPQLNLCEKNMKEKIDYIVESLESLENSIETLKLHVTLLSSLSYEDLSFLISI